MQSVLKCDYATTISTKFYSIMIKFLRRLGGCRILSLKYINPNYGKYKSIYIYHNSHAKAHAI